MLRLVAADGSAWSRSLSETIPTRRPAGSTTGSRLIPRSRIILSASLIGAFGETTMGGCDMSLTSILRPSSSN